MTITEGAKDLEMLETLVEDIKELRTNALCGDDNETLPPEAEQHFLLALAALDTAQRHATLAKYCRMQGR